MSNLLQAPDTELISKIKSSNCSPSMEELIRRHKDLVYNTIHKFHKKNSSIDKYELLEDLHYIFFNSVNSFDSTKGAKFSTWLCHMTRFHCLDFIKETANTIPIENEDLDILNCKLDRFYSEDSKNKDDKDYIITILGELKDKRILEIFKLRYLTGSTNKVTSWSEISKKLNLSISHVINLFERGKKILVKKLKSNDLFDII